MEEFKEFIYDKMKYLVGNNGTVIGVRGKIKSRYNSDGYEEVTMGREKGKRRKFLVHRLVAQVFIPNPNNLPEVNHIDYDRKNNNNFNLEWTTHSDNIKYSSNSGRFKNTKSGSKNGRARIDEKDVLRIRELYEGGMLRSALAKMFNIGWTTVDHIIKRETWYNI